MPVDLAIFEHADQLLYVICLFEHVRQSFPVDGFYLVLNMASNHYSAVRLTYQMGIVLPYAFGIVSAAKNKKIYPFLLLLLVIQFIILLSFFWILPWWFVTQPKVI